MRDLNTLEADLDDGSLTFGTSNDTYVTGSTLAACFSAKTSVRNYGANCMKDATTNKTSCNLNSLICNNYDDLTCDNLLDVKAGMNVSATAPLGSVNVFVNDPYTHEHIWNSSVLSTEALNFDDAPTFSGELRRCACTSIRLSPPILLATLVAGSVSYSLADAATFASSSLIHHVQYFGIDAGYDERSWIYATASADVELSPSFIWAIR